MNTIEVPDYVASDFKVAPGHPSRMPGAVEQSLQRVYRLIAHALVEFEPSDWVIDDEPMYRSSNVCEPTGLQRFRDGFVVYGEQRGQRSVLALFKSSNMAAKYFVFLVSGGKRQIDWTLFGEMEP